MLRLLNYENIVFFYLRVFYKRCYYDVPFFLNIILQYFQYISRNYIACVANIIIINSFNKFNFVLDVARDIFFFFFYILIVPVFELCKLINYLNTFCISLCWELETSIFCVYLKFAVSAPRLLVYCGTI